MTELHFHPHSGRRGTGRNPNGKQQDTANMYIQHGKREHSFTLSALTETTSLCGGQKETKRKELMMEVSVITLVMS